MTQYLPCPHCWGPNYSFRIVDCERCGGCGTLPVVTYFYPANPCQPSTRPVVAGDDLEAFASAAGLRQVDAAAVAAGILRGFELEG